MASKDKTVMLELGELKLHLCHRFGLQHTKTFKENVILTGQKQRNETDPTEI